MNGIDLYQHSIYLIELYYKDISRPKFQTPWAHPCHGVGAKLAGT